MPGRRVSIDLDMVSIVFGNKPEAALSLMDAGLSREQIQSETGQILGVHDCSLSVQEGEIVVLMGLSGSGKSTLLRAVNGLNPVTRGAVRVDDGNEMVNIDANTARLRFFRRHRITMVFQQFGLLPWRTVADNVGFGLEVAGVNADKRQAAVREKLVMVNLSEWENCKIHELSGGMQQRVGLARAFATESPILLMDEPFSALDPLIRIRLQDELLELQKTLRRTILFVSHDLDEALKLGSRIVIMEGGRIIQIGAPEDIILNPKTEYVADFVAHMNPLKTMRAASVMSTLAEEQTAIQTPAPAVAPETAASSAGKVEADDLLLDVVRTRQQHAPPLRVFKDGVHVGVINDGDIYRALLQQR